MKMTRKRVIVAFGLLCLVSLTGVGQEPGVTPVRGMADVQAAALRDSLQGRWTSQIGRITVVMTFDPNSRVQIGGQEPYEGLYRVREGELVLSSLGRTEVYKLDVTVDTLSLSGNGLVGTVKWHRSLHLDNRSLWKDAFAWKTLKTRGYRFLFIVVVIVVCQVFLWLLGGVFHILIYSNQGPLKHIYRYDKSRTMTIYSILLNASKYVVYVLAIGFVLNELGINYTTYLASLSVVGLAIGFGSQGLVQDMVTGFFIIFEDQFNVGDMVEVNKHVGVVEELGLRMTRIKNYQDQRVVIPNRNISIVSNYSRGSLTANVDVAVADKENFDLLSQAMIQVAGEVKQQFDRLIMDVPKSAIQVKLESGECFARLALRIWPGEQWVIDSQLVPRLREYCLSHAIEILKDRVIVFYGSGRVKSMRAIKKRIRWVRESKVQSPKSKV